MHISTLSAYWEESGTDPQTGNPTASIVLRFGDAEVTRWEGVDGCQFQWGDASEALDEFVAGKLTGLFQAVERASMPYRAKPPPDTSWLQTPGT